MKSSNRACCDDVKGIPHKVGETLHGLGETEDFWCGAKGYLHRHLNRNEREDPRKGGREGNNEWGRSVGRSEVHQTN